MIRGKCFIHHIILIALCLWPYQWLTAQTDDFSLSFTRYDTLSGFPQDRVHCIFQDSQGFMWFGTNNGLTKYDAYTFSHYPPVSDGDAGPAISQVYALFEDKDGVLWIGGNNGLSRHLRGSDRFKNFFNPEPPPKREDANFISHIHESPTRPGLLWLGTRAGLVCFDKKSQRFLPPPPPFPNHLERLFLNKQILKIMEPSPGSLYIVYSNGILKYLPDNDTATGYSTYIPSQLKIPLDSQSGFQSILHTPEYPDVIFLGSGDGILIFDRSDGTFTASRDVPRFRRFPDIGAVNTIITSTLQKDVFWLGAAANGLYRVNIRTGTVNLYKNHKQKPNSLSGNEVESLHQTTSGILWVGTTMNGLNKADPGQKKFKHYFESDETDNHIKSEVIWHISQCLLNKDRIWLGTAAGLESFNRKTGRFTYHKVPLFHFPPPTSTNETKTESLVSCIHQSPHNPDILWLGTRQNGLKRYDINSGKLKHYYSTDSPPQVLPTNYIIDMHESPVQPGILWLATFGKGLCAFDTKTETFTVQPGVPSRLLSLYEPIRQPGTLLISCLPNGILKFDCRTRRSAVITKRESESYTVFAFYESRLAPDVIWFGGNKGLHRMILSDSQIRFDTRKFLNGHTVFSILEDDHRNLWCGTQNGLAQCNQRSDEVKHYSIKDGLQGTSFSAAACRTHDGQLFFGGYRGFNAFYPHQIKKNPHKPPVVITDLLLFNDRVEVAEPDQQGRVILERGINETKRLELPYTEKIITFKYTALCYRNSEDVKYAFKLEGFEKDWNTVGDRRLATYTWLEPGRYTFRVKACNNDGLWNEEGAALQLEIMPPWWRTTGAYAGYFAFLVLLTILLSRWQQYRGMKAERRRAEVVEMELRAMAAEAEARAVEAENKRKTQELEEARKLQLSMLPQQVPQRSDLDIAVYMKTAAEVGGDYYDFAQPPDGSFIAAIGDATGHGLKAGTMVSVLKTIFVDKAADGNLEDFFKRTDEIIKQMHMGHIFMGLTLVHVRPHHLIIASAGMPPPLLFRKTTGAVEAINLKAPPIGAFKRFIFRHQQVPFYKGDVLLMLSDGLPEQFDADGNMFGYARVTELLKRYGDLAPEQIITRLIKEGDVWLKDTPPDDDITFVAMKKKT